MSNKDVNQINEEKLDKVSGGFPDYASDKHLPPDHGEHISANEAKNHIGDEVYVVFDRDPYNYCYGTLIDSKPGKDYYGENDTVHIVFVKGRGNCVRSYNYYKLDTNNEIPSNYNTLYKKNSL